jgi:5-methylcytosine-specific restriction protein A
MPYRPRTPCTEPGCPELVERPGKCKAHARIYERERRRRMQAYNYGRAWRRLRLAVLSEQPICPCGAKASEVDHVVPLSAGGTHDRSNLMARCKPCHSRKTLKENRGG